MPSRSDYSSGLDNAPAAYMDDDSDDDVGKPALGGDKKLDYDSDEKDEGDNEMVSISPGNELIELGDGKKAALNIPKLNAPK